MNKQRTRHSLLLLVGMATAATAGSVFASHDDGLFRGFYSSLSAGGVQTAAKIDTATSALVTVGVAESFATPLTSRDWNNSGTGALTLGYGDFIANNFHLAGEIFVNVARRHNSQNISSLVTEGADALALGTITSAKLRNWEYGVDLKPGYLYNPCSMVYARVGAAFNRLTVDSASALNNVAGGAQADSFVSFSDDRSRAGLRLGLGLEHAMTPNLSFIADYIYTHYGRVSANGAADAFSPGGATVALGLQDTASARLHSQSATIGLKYYFL